MLNRSSVLLYLSLAVITVFCGLIFFFSTNIPQQDGYDSILHYPLNSRESLSSGLFDLQVSHRLVVTRLLARLSLLPGHGMDFRFLVYIGSMCLLAVVFLLYRSLQKSPDRNLARFLICLSVFSLFHWSNMAWATAAVQN